MRSLPYASIDRLVEIRDRKPAASPVGLASVQFQSRVMVSAVGLSGAAAIAKPVGTPGLVAGLVVAGAAAAAGVAIAVNQVLAAGVGG